MSSRFKTNQIPENLTKLQKPGYFILDNNTKKVFIMPNGTPATFKSREEAVKYVIDNNIDGLVK